MELDTPIATGEITNTCTCTVYDEVAEEYTDEPTADCYGDCWDFALEDFANVTEELRNSNETNWWKVEDLRLWNGQVSGYFHAKYDSIADILRGMTVNSQWTMRYAVFSDRIEFNLAHHDAPLGSASTLRCVSDDEREEMGLY